MFAVTRCVCSDPFLFLEFGAFMVKPEASRSSEVLGMALESLKGEWVCFFLQVVIMRWPPRIILDGDEKLMI
jgi:hypothetical protein